MLLPPSIHTANLSKKWAWMTLGGPITSLVFGIVSGYIYMVSYYQFLLYFSVLHFVIFLATAIPMKGMMLSDGKQFLILIKGDGIQEFLNIDTIRRLSIEQVADTDEHIIKVDNEALPLKLAKDQVEKLVQKMREVRRLELAGKK